MLLAVAPVAVRAQQPTQAPADSVTQQQAYESRRAALVKELQATQDQLSQLREERVALEARVDSALALTLEKRASMLLMSPEQNALVRLDATLSSAQDEMLAQRDRMQALGDAVRARAGALLVVLFRADSAQGAALGPVALSVDDAPAVTRTYSATAADALRQGAVDQLYRSEVLPTTHTVSASVTIGGQTVTQGLNVNAQRETVTYVQFTIRNGQLVPSTWTSQGTAPF